MDEFDLPDGWSVAPIRALISHEGLISDGDWVESKDQNPDGSVRLIQLADIGDGGFRNKSKRFMTFDSAKSLNCTYLKKDDVLIARMPDPLGRACIFPDIGQEAVTVVDICLIRTANNSAITSELLMYWLNSPSMRNKVEANASGTTRKRITRKKLEQFEVFLPPLAEQKIIADKLDTLLAQVETTKARLDNTLNILKRFRQSVLAAAVSGKLTNGWLEKNNVNPLLDLQKELQFNQEKAKKVESTSFHEIVLNCFPKSWVISTFSNIYKFIDYRGKTPKKSESGKRLYTAKNIKMGFISDQPVEYVSNKDFELWMTRGFSKIGDIFFVTEGHTMGCTAMNNIGDDIALAQRTLTLQPYGKVITKFHHYYMMTTHFQKLVELNATGSAAKGIKAAKFRGLPLPFPSLEEQTQIVQQVEKLFAHADQIEQQTQTALDKVNNLTQSILAKAFKGELTADWRAANPDLITGDNSAQALLAKIQAERAELAKKAKAKKKPVTRKKKA